MIGHPAIYAAQALASGLAVALAARFRAHRPLAVLVPFGLALDVALELVGPAPAGWRFGAGVVLGSAYPWAVLAAVAVVLGGRKDEGAPRQGDVCPRAPSWRVRAPRLAGENVVTGDRSAKTEVYCRGAAMGCLAGWLPCVALILATGIRGPALARVYAGMQAVVALALAVTVVRWRERREARTVTEACAIVCAAAEVANIPAYIGLPSWWSARAVYAFAYGVLVYLQARALWRLTCRSN